MKALSKLRAEPGIWLVEDAERPRPAPNQVLIKPHKTAICGTDIHIYTWDDWAQKTIKTPMIIGHEFVGEVVEFGELVTGYKKGDIVSGEGHIVCGNCRNCRGGTQHLCPKTLGLGVNISGAFAEYFVHPADNLFKVPAGIDKKLAAIFDPMGNAVHTALSFDLVGEDVLVTGAGPVGIMGGLIAQHVGARYVVVTEPNEYRRTLAKKMGLKYVYNPLEISLTEIMKQLGMTEGFDIGLEMSGNGKAFNQMLAAMNNGASIGLLGLLPDQLGIDWSLVIFKGLFLKGIYGREMYETWYKMTAMLQSGLDLSGMVTHEFAVADYQVAFDTMLSGKSGKVLLNWEA